MKFANDMIHLNWNLFLIYNTLKFSIKKLRDHLNEI